MVVPVSMRVGDRHAIRLAGAGAFALAERAALRQSLHVVVVALLDPTDVLFKAEHLCSVLAERAVHGGVASQYLGDSLFERVHHQVVVAEIARREKLHRGMIGSHQFSVLADSAHQNP